MKIAVLLLSPLLALSLQTPRANACAGCVSLIPETTVLQESVTSSILAKAPLLKNDSKKVILEKMSCSRSNLFSAKGVTYSCFIKGNLEGSGLTMNFAAVNAISLFSQFKSMTAEATSENDPNWERDGSRAPLFLVQQGLDALTVTMPTVTYGTLACPKVYGKNRCEITVYETNATIVTAQ